MAKTKLYTIYMALYGAKCVSASMLSSNLWYAKSQRSGQVCHIVLPREAYYSSQVSRVCVAPI